MSGTNPFTQVFVTENPTDQSKLVQWKFNPSFTVDPAYGLYVESARAADDTWTRLNTIPITECMYTDITQYKYNYRHDIYYRIVLDNNGTEYISEPSNVRGTLDKTEYRLMKQTLKAEYLRFTKYHVGTEGWLVKKRIHGAKCTQCADYDLPNDGGLSTCSTCYGTSIVGGYYQGYPYYVDFVQLDTHNKDIVLPFGTEDGPFMAGRCIAYPMLASYDLWVEKDTNKRYVIRQIKTEVRIKDTPLVYIASFHELPSKRVEYTVPIFGDTPGVSDVEEEWRNAVDYNL